MKKNHILITLSESDKTAFGKQDFARQSLPQKVFSAIWALESEVNDGGFSQYFLNSTGESTPFALEALRTIGAPKTAAIWGLVRFHASDWHIDSHKVGVLGFSAGGHLGTRYFSSTHVIPLEVSQSQTSVPSRLMAGTS